MDTSAVTLGPVRASLIASVALLLGVGCAAADDADRAMGAGALATAQAPVSAPVCADGPTTFGIDVSHWQGTINWPQVAGAGVKYAVIRVSHGLNILDSKFVQNWNGAKDNGILRGIYQFFSADQDPIAQADLVLDYLETHGPGDLPPVLDVEWTDGQTPATITARVGQWLAHMEAAVGRKPMIYTGSYFWEDNVGGLGFGDNPLWIPNWGTDCPSLPAPWTDWVFHQYSATGSVAGISGDVDLNRFNGNFAALQAWIGASECVDDPSYSTCDGTQRVTCGANNQLQTGDCAAFGATCSTAGGAAHCVHFKCHSNLNGGETGTFCDGTGAIGTCQLGEFAATACAAGTSCSEAGDAPHCVDDRCAAGLGGGETGAFCADATHIATCTGGAFSQAPCASGATCSASGGTPHCVDPRCPAGLGGDETGTFCVGNSLAQCQQGSYTETPCPGGGGCDTSGGAHCVDPGCVAGQSGSFCVNGTDIGTCQQGAFSRSTCPGGGQCSASGGVPHCVDARCAAGLAGGENGAFCADDDTVASCTDGAYAETACGMDGRRCALTTTGAARCVDASCYTAFGGDDGSLCASTTLVARCAGGVYTESPCAPGRTCQLAGGTALCVLPGEVPDAGPAHDGGADDTGGADASTGEASANPVRSVNRRTSIRDGDCAGGGADPAALWLIAVLGAATLMRRRQNIERSPEK